MASERHATRLNAFTDAAFAFALTLLIVAGADRPTDLSVVGEVARQIPGYLGAFAIIAMFWSAHVGWSRRDGAVTPATIMLTLSLIFLVLIFVYPLRTLSQTGADLIMGDRSVFRDSSFAEAQLLFIFYGLGFAAMAASIAGLFCVTLRSGRYDSADSDDVTDNFAIWSLIAGVGVFSAALAIIPGLARFAPWSYWLIPILVVAYNLIQKRRRVEPAAEIEDTEADG